MAKVYSEVIFEEHDVGDGGFTVDEDVLLIVRTYNFFVASAAGGQCQLVHTDIDTTIIWVPVPPSASGQYFYRDDCRIILSPGGTYTFNNNVGFGEHPVDVGLYGYKLSLP